MLGLRGSGQLQYQYLKYLLETQPKPRTPSANKLQQYALAKDIRCDEAIHARFIELTQYEPHHVVEYLRKLGPGAQFRVDHDCDKNDALLEAQIYLLEHMGDMHTAIRVIQNRIKVCIERTLDGLSNDDLESVLQSDRVLSKLM